MELRVLCEQVSKPSHFLSCVHRKSGANKLVKIYHRNGKYGFVETQMDFNSVNELIEYYRSNSLGRHNKSLDINLKYPMSRISQVRGGGVSCDFQAAN